MQGIHSASIEVLDFSSKEEPSNTMTAASKVIIADDHPLFRDALRQALNKAFGELKIITCGSFATLQRTLEGHNDSNLILLDLHMPGAVGFSALRYLGLRCPEIPVAIVSAHEEHDIMMKALEHGASGFIAKSSALPDIIDSVQRIMLGDVVLPKGVDVQYPSTTINTCLLYTSPSPRDS